MAQILSADAPFRQYKTTDEEIQADGYRTGLEWPAYWAHLPGGPYYPIEPKFPSATDFHPDWIAYRELLKHHNVLWIAAWHKGFKENARLNRNIAIMRAKLITDKLAA